MLTNGENHWNNVQPDIGASGYQQKYFFSSIGVN